MDPLMTVNAHTFVSDALRLGGGLNVFADRERRFPLAADLGQAIPRAAGSRDTRYPRVTLEEVEARSPQIVLLPDEPHPFSEADAEVFRKRLPDAKVVRCGGRDFSWYGVQSVEGVPRLRALIDSLR
jgi:ABC-type Fe3+-hydroxamate transport system substrate-binding protein